MLAPMKQFYLFTICLFSFSLLANEAEWLPFNTDPFEITQQNGLEFSIFPNPVKNERLYIKTNNSAEKHIEIFNELGERKLEVFTFNESIYLGELPSGIYIFKLEQDGKSGLKRLVIP
jgi:hypothetical protein